MLCRAVLCFSFAHTSKQVCTYMHVASGLFSWSMELLAFASCMFEPKVSDHLPHLSSSSILLCERVTPSSALSLAQLSSVLNLAQLRSAQQRRAVPCGAMPCCAFSFVHTGYHAKVPGTRVFTCIESHKKKRTQLNRGVRSAAPCGAVRCCAVLCCAFS